MVLPAPNLDDRRFQDLVDDAKRLVAAQCPEWTDHNVSDPGVTIIEAFAFMVDELFYRLNRVPDRLYTSFLDLLGVTLYPPTAARVDVVFWLAAARDHDVAIPLGAEVGTRRTEDEESIVFATTEERTVSPRSLAQLGTQAEAKDPRVRSPRLEGAELAAFSDKPVPGDTLLFGLDDAAPDHAIALRLDCAVRGVGVDPLDPPLVWEAWAGKAWVVCDVVADGTGGLNGAGDVVLILPATHTASVIGGTRAGWLRCRLIEPGEGKSMYSASPVVRAASATSVGGVVPAIHAATVTDEVIGLSEGVPGQSFPLDARPVLNDGTPFVVEVGSGAGWEEWTEVDSFAGSGSEDRHLLIDRSRGVVAFPPAVREADGALRAFGAIPPKGAPLRVPAYRVGGGMRGNVSAESLSVVRTTIPFVRGCENRAAATGGSDGETVDQAKVRGPLVLRTRDRAVTAQDYEQLAKRAAPGIARVHCVRATSAGEALGVRLLVVPTVAVDEEGRSSFADLIPDDDLLATIAGDIDARRPAGARVVIEPPVYQGLTVVASLIARPRVSVASLRTAATRALYAHFDPIRGGLDGTGWPFGRPVHAGEVYAVLQALPGTELVEEVLLFGADPATGKRGEAVQRIDLDPHALVFSFEHRVRVRAGV